MSLEGLKLAALYSYNCRKAQKLKINQLLLEFIKKGTNQEKAIRGLKKLISYTWYRIIVSRAGTKDPFDERVVRAYWVGNELSEPIGKKESFLFPFHNFTILVPLDSYKPSPIAINECKISVGKVEKVEGKILFVRCRSIVRENNKFLLANSAERKKVERRFINKVKKGDWITFHYSIGREVVSEEDANLLYQKTKEAIKLFNKAHLSKK